MSSKKGVGSMYPSREEEIKALKVRIEEIRNDLNSLEARIDSKPDVNAVKVIINEQNKSDDFVSKEDVESIIYSTLQSKRFMTETDVNNVTKQNQITMIKWMIGTCLSVGTVILGVLRVINM